MRKHDLKTRPKYFQPLWDRRKNFEVRRNDREFRAGDILHLREWDPGQPVDPDASKDARYTDRSIHAVVTYVLHLEDAGFLQDGDYITGDYVVMAVYEQRRGPFDAL